MKNKSERRKQAKEMLEAQLVRGTKPRKNGRMWNSYPEEDIVRMELSEKEIEEGKLFGKPLAVKLSPTDVKRINKELEGLSL